MSLRTRLKPQKILVEQSVVREPLTAAILGNLPDAAVEFVDGPGLKKTGRVSSELIITRRRGAAIKKCPGTPVYQCCDYYVLNLGIGCSSNCHYCYLHHYMNSPSIIYVNVSDLIKEVREFAATRPTRILRLGSGEFIDSLGIDEFADFNRILVPAIGGISNIIFEIKTKSKKVEHLLDLDHQGRVVVSWSLNSEAMVEAEEPDTDSLIERIEAAALCRNAGYRIGFHFDPLIHYDGWESGYERVVELVFRHFGPGDIAWISLGALRFKRELKTIIREKFPSSRLIYGELIPGLDSKLRYFLPIRRRMFSRMIQYIRARDDQVPVYLCMEDKELAQEVGAIAGFSDKHLSKRRL